MRTKIMTALAVLALMLGIGGVAYAAEQKPLVGTGACDMAVAADTSVKAAQARLAALPATAPLADRQAATKAIDDAQKAATATLCTTSTSTPPSTSTTPPATAGPSIVELCAATSISQVDALLDQITGAVPSQLKPLIDAKIINASSPTVVNAVQVSDVKKALACSTAPTTSATPTTQAPTTTVKPGTFADCGEARAAGKAPLLIGDTGYDASLDTDNDGIACEDADGDATGSGATGSAGGDTSLPTGGVDTGDGSTVIG